MGINEQLFEKIKQGDIKGLIMHHLPYDKLMWMKTFLTKQQWQLWNKWKDWVSVSMQVREWAAELKKTHERTTDFA